MVDKLSLGLALLGVVACLAVHAAAWLGSPAKFEVTFVLLAGCLFIWWRALRAASASFQTREPRALWEAVTSRCPSWVKHTYQPMTYYFMVYWLWVLYVAMILKAKPSPELWARFYSAGELVFYFFGGAFLWAASRPRGVVGTT